MDITENAFDLFEKKTFQLFHKYTYVLVQKSWNAHDWVFTCLTSWHGNASAKLALCEENLLVTCGFPLQKSNKAELWCFLNWTNCFTISWCVGNSGVRSRIIWGCWGVGCWGSPPCIGFIYYLSHHDAPVMTSRHHKYNRRKVHSQHDGGTFLMCKQINTYMPLGHTYASVNRVSIGPDNGLAPIRRHAIIWTNAGLLLIRTLGTNVSEILITIQTFSFKKMHLKISSAKWRPFCP